MSNPSRKPKDDVRFRVLRMLEENPDMSQRDLAESVGIGLGSANYCLKALIDKGFVKLGNFSGSSNKRGYAYVLTPKGLSEKTVLAGRFLKRKIAEYENLKAEVESLQAELDQGNDQKLERT